MAKLMLTSFCNQRCSYCFADHRISSERFPRELSIDLLKRFLVLSERNLVVLSGGEPMLHSRIGEILEMLYRKGRQTAILTNGCYRPEIVDAVPLDGVRQVLINATSEPATEASTAHLRRNIAIFLERGIHVTLGCTLYSPTMALVRFYELLSDFPIRAVRLGLANPSPGSVFKALGFADFISGMAPFFQDTVYKLNELGIRPTIDCGLPPCIVAPEKYAEFRLRTFWDQSCRSDLSLFPDGNLYHCHCSLDDFYPLETIAAARKTAAQKEAALRRSMPASEACGQCQHWTEGKCQGGCLGWRIQWAKR